MQIELSKAEYRTLLGVLEIADRVLFAHRADRPSDRKEYFTTHRDYERRYREESEEYGLKRLEIEG
jgi:hypothetical protein